jgi:hypothetical protein
MRYRLTLVLFLAVVAATVLAAAPSAGASSHVSVNITGQVHGAGPFSGFLLHVQAHADGDSLASLSGQGTDNFVDHGNRFGLCIAPLTGFVSGSTVTLSGTTTFANLPADIGVPVTFIADASTGAITWIFDGLTFTGTGIVDIHD